MKDTNHTKGKKPAVPAGFAFGLPLETLDRIVKWLSLASGVA